VSLPKERTNRMPVWKNSMSNVNEKGEVMTEGCGMHNQLELYCCYSSLNIVQRSTEGE
jgi:hypothetical protein